MTPCYTPGEYERQRPDRPRRRPAGRAAVEVSFPVVGMTCASCSNRIERFLRKTDGVVEANVNLATEIATIRYLPEAVGRGELVGAIEKAGYEVRPGALEAAEARATGGRSRHRRRDAELDETERIRAREQRELGIQAAVSIGVAIGIMVLMFAPAPADDGTTSTGSSSGPRPSSSSGPGAATTRPPGRAPATAART